MVSPFVRSLVLGVSISATMLWLAATEGNAQQPTPPGQAGSSGPPSLGTQPTSPGATHKTPGSTDRLTDSLFLRLDKNHDKAIDETELNSTDAARYRDYLKSGDRDGNGKITQEEFRRIGELPFYRDPKSLAALLLVLGFASFCMFLDGLLEPDRRDYLLWSIVGSIVLTGLAYLFAQHWFFEAKPFLGFVAAIPVLLIVLAFLTGATKEQEEKPTAPTGPVVYKVGKPTAEGAAAQKPGPTAGQKPGQPVPGRKFTSPLRTPRPAPLPRPPVPERRPPTPPRSQPPRPPGPSAPGSGPKPPPPKKP